MIGDLYVLGSSTADKSSWHRECHIEFFDLAEHEIEQQRAKQNGVAVNSMVDANAAIKRLSVIHVDAVEFLVVKEETGERTIIKPEHLHTNAA